MWWEAHYTRPFDPSLLLDTDLRDWRKVRQQDDGAAPTTINRALSTLRGYCAWAAATGLTTENAAVDIEDVPTPELAPRALPPAAVKALLRAARAEKDTIIRLRDEAALALLIYGGLRVQEACDLQLRDVDLAGLSITVRYGKAGKARRVPIHTDAQRLLQRYLDQVRCPDGLSSVGSEAEREPFLARIDAAAPGRPLRPGVNQRLIQRMVTERAQEAAERLRRDAERESDLARMGELLDLARRLGAATPHTLRHSLARRMIERGADLGEVRACSAIPTSPPPGAISRPARMICGKRSGARGCEKGQEPYSEAIGTRPEALDRRPPRPYNESATVRLTRRDSAPRLLESSSLRAVCSDSSAAWKGQLVPRRAARSHDARKEAYP
jgi:site-specific recombinase XerD